MTSDSKPRPSHLLARVHGDGQAVGHQAGRFVLLDQLHRNHRKTHLRASTRTRTRINAEVRHAGTARDSAHLDVLPEEVGGEAQPVPGDEQSSLKENVAQQRARVH